MSVGPGVEDISSVLCSLNPVELQSLHITEDQALFFSSLLQTKVDSLVSDELMEIVSLHLVQLFRALLANSDKASDSIPQLPQSSASRRSTSLVQDSFAVRLFCFVRFIADIVECTAFEILYIVFLIEKLAREDINSSSNKKGSLITPNNIGTLLVCSFVVALKYLRDHAPPTSWWTRTLRLPATVLPVSERTFLAHLDYRLSINNDDFQRLRVFFGV